MTIRPQTELALHTNVAVSDIQEDVVGIRGDVVDIRGDVVDIREDVANARELISDVHRAVVKDQEAGGISNQVVSNHSVLPAVEKFLQFPGSNQVCSFNCSHRPEALPLSPEYSENRLPHPREPVSDGRS